MMLHGVSGLAQADTLSTDTGLPMSDTPIVLPSYTGSNVGPLDIGGQMVGDVYVPPASGIIPSNLGFNAPTSGNPSSGFNWGIFGSLFPSLVSTAGQVATTAIASGNQAQAVQAASAAQIASQASTLNTSNLTTLGIIAVIGIGAIMLLKKH